jgi:yecA family protein
MTDNSVIDLDNFQELLDRFEIFAHPSEIHGMLSGLLCGGTKLSDTEWINIVSDFYHQGLKFHEEVVIRLELMFRHVYEALNDEQLGFQMLLPDDDEALTIRTKALAGWAQGFLLGIGINRQALDKAPDEINEAIKDFAEISKMATEADDNEENENAFFELHEYIRISTIMCFNELGGGRQSNEKITLH